MYEDLRTSISDLEPWIDSTLADLIRIPSVSAAGFDPAEVRRSAEVTADLLSESGAGGVRLLEVDAAHPAVFGEVPGPPGSPTVLLYAHHDVQPPGPDELWEGSPFEPTERQGRLYGRGSSDDKCGIVTHLAVLRALEGRSPVGVKLFFEGEEETGSEHLYEFLSQHGDLLEADVFVIADSGFLRVGEPVFTTSLRGLVDCVVEVRALAAGVHSGLFGGAVPDALTSLTRILATLHDSRGRPTLEGLAGSEVEGASLTEEEVRSQAGVLDSVELIGTGSLESRMWTQPAISVLAIDAPPVSEAINQLVPVARAKVSLRLAPGDDPARAMKALTDHLVEAAPWGVQVEVTPGAAGDAYQLDTTGPAYDAYRQAYREAWGVEASQIGVGGSIPFVAAISERYPDAAILLTGAADATSAAHGPNESISVDDLHKACLAEAIALRALGSAAG